MEIFVNLILFYTLQLWLIPHVNSELIIDKVNNLNSALSDEEQSITCGPYYSLTKSLLNCEVKLIYAEYSEYSEYSNINEDRRGLEGCYKNDRNNFIITVNHLIKNVSFECTSNTPLDIKIYFEHEAPIAHYTTVIRERIAQDYADSNNYMYKLKMKVPTFPLIYGPGLLKRTTVVKYKILEIGNPSADLNALFYILEDNWSLLNNSKAHWMKENSTVVAKDEFVNIPCLSLSEQMWLFRLQDEILQKVDDGVRYDIYGGIFIDPEFVNVTGEFICSVIDFMEQNATRNLSVGTTWKNSTGKYQKFQITLPQELFVEPVSAEEIVSEEDLYDLQRKQEPFYLLCSHRSRNVTMNVYFFSKSGNIEAKITQSLQTKPERRFEVTTMLSHLPADNCIRDWTGINCLHDFIGVECVDVETKEHIYRWNLRTKQTISDEENMWVKLSRLFYDFDERNFICEPYISNVLPADISIRHLACDNEFQCRQLSKCLRYVGTNEDDIDISEPLCISTETTFAKTPCQPTNSENKQFHCAVAKPLVNNKGNLQCLVKAPLIEEAATLQFYFETYFEGLNGELYGTYKNEIPRDAVLKLRKFDNLPIYNTGGKFGFRCEAHSFIFEEGLVWLFKLSEKDNGSITTKKIPDELITYDPDSIDVYFSSNPHSTVEITFPDVFITEVICAAPRMYSKVLWDTTSINVTIRDSIAPNITSEDVDNFFKVGQAGQTLICKANGFPLPEINWFFNGMEIQDPLQILDKVIYKVLLFPQFDKSFAGDYNCMASNILGNTTKTFHVVALELAEETDDSNDVLNFTLGYVALSILLVIAIVVPFWYYRKRRNERKEKMKEIIGLLNGSDVQSEKMSLESGDYVDLIIQFPYNKQFELKRDSFTVSTEIFGRGNFGEVYKGHVEGIDGMCAFKTLPVNSTMSELRTIVYELKILNYIGKHENIVHFVGAYTKEVFEGKIYIVTEFCSLGSLDNFLSNNKELFVENINSDEIGDDDFTCSYQRLLIWCKQISNALDYIWSKRVLHGDVATRNVLLSADGNAKLTDFGLSRRLDKDYKYIKKSNDALPWQWQWLAVECLMDHSYSVHSDVWAYGITLWEIFTLGDVPYPGLNPPKEGSNVFWTMLIAQLESGLLRNNQPKYASPQIYEIIKSCWEIQPKSRPSFNSLKYSFENIIRDWKLHKDHVKVKVKDETSASVRLRNGLVESSNVGYTNIGLLSYSDNKLTEDEKDAVEHGYVPKTRIDQ